MADDDVIDLNALIDQRLNLFNKANQTFLTKPTIGAGAARGSQLIANDLYRRMFPFILLFFLLNLSCF